MHGPVSLVHVSSIEVNEMCDMGGVWGRVQAYPNMPIYLGDKIRTDSNAITTLEFQNRTQIGVNKGTVVFVDTKARFRTSPSARLCRNYYCSSALFGAGLRARKGTSVSRLRRRVELPAPGADSAESRTAWTRGRWILALN